MRRLAAPHSTTPALAALASMALAGCAAPTEVLVMVFTDVPSTVPLGLTVRTSRGRVLSSAPTVQQWQRAPLDAGRGADAGIELPASFAVVPADGPHDGPVYVELEVNAGGVLFRRQASFQFVPQRSLTFRVFLTSRCLAPATGCLASPCTAWRRCEEQGQTCGDEGTCIAIPTTPGSNADASFNTTAPPCGDYGQPCCYVGDQCGAPLSCVNERCQRCTDPAEQCCNGPDFSPTGTACMAMTNGGLVPATCSAGVCSAVDPPTGVTATAASSSALAVQWTAPASGAASYTVERSTDAAFTAPTSTAGVTATSLAVTGLSQGRRYYVRVRSVAADGRMSAWSAVANAVTGVDAPATPGVSVTVDGVVRLESDCCWVQDPGVGMYHSAHCHASSSCPAGTSVEYRFQAQYTGTSTVYGWTGWMGADAYVAQPRSGYGVHFYAQARCVGPDAASGASGTGTACQLNGGGGC